MARFFPYGDDEVALRFDDAVMIVAQAASLERDSRALPVALQDPFADILRAWDLIPRELVSGFRDAYSSWAHEQDRPVSPNPHSEEAGRKLCAYAVAIIAFVQPGLEIERRRLRSEQERIAEELRRRG